MCVCVCVCVCVRVHMVCVCVCVCVCVQAENSLPDNKVVLEELKKEDILKAHMKKIMPFVQHIKVVHTQYMYTYSIHCTCTC